MREHIEVIYENGVFRPLAPLLGPFCEHQHLIVTIEEPNGADNWLDDADSTVNLEDVRHALAKVSTSLAQAMYAERAER